MINRNNLGLNQFERGKNESNRTEINRFQLVFGAVPKLKKIGLVVYFGPKPDRTKNAQSYSKLISCLFVVEKNNKLLIKNYVSQLISSTLFPEVNAIIYNNNYGHVCGHGRGRGRGHRRRWNNFHNNNGYPYQDNNDIYFDHLDMIHLDVADFFKKMIIKLIFFIMIIIS